MVINLRIRDAITPLTQNPRDGFQSGIFFADGQPKPSATAFAFPFVTERINDGAVRAWGKAPSGGTLVIQRKAKRSWVAVKRIDVSQGAVFATKLRSRGKQRFRASVGNLQSLVWKQR